MELGGIRQGLARYAEAYKKGRVRSAIGPYFRALQESGIDRADIEYLVNNNISLYDNYLPQSWKKALIQKAAGIASYIDTSDETIRVFVEAVTEEVPWFAEVVTSDRIEWVRREIHLILRDLKAAD